jgi:hypothetical protein
MRAKPLNLVIESMSQFSPKPQMNTMGRRIMNATGHQIMNATGVASHICPIHCQPVRFNQIEATCWLIHVESDWTVTGPI